MANEFNGDVQMSNLLKNTKPRGVSWYSRGMCWQANNRKGVASNGGVKHHVGYS